MKFECLHRGHISTAGGVQKLIKEGKLINSSPTGTICDVTPPLREYDPRFPNTDYCHGQDVACFGPGPLCRRPEDVVIH